MRTIEVQRPSAVIRTVIMIGMLTGFCLGLQAQPVEKIEIEDFPEKQEVEVRLNGQLFTRYLYGSRLEKPILYPIYTTQGDLITRGYPLMPVAGERADHPHHVGLWFNYGDVNGLDFWNNSSAIPEDRKSKYGRIVHTRIETIDPQTDRLEASATWQDHQGKVLLDERTSFTFAQTGQTSVIDRTTTLTARTEVLFKDNKEGMIGIRVTRALELPDKNPVTLTDKNGQPKKEKVVDNAGVTGDYLSSTGLTGHDVWGTRGEWVRLSGNIHGRDVSIVLIDHPENPGYPTYWHARGYGLFAANTLGQHAFDPSQQLNFSLKKGASVTFRYRVLIDGEKHLTREEIEKSRAQFISGN
jgi:hypothetical protein